MEEKNIVTLVKMGDFTFDEKTYKTVDKEVFDMLVEVKSDNPESEKKAQPEVFYFKDKSVYANTAYKYDIDKNKPVYIDGKGQIFCFREFK